MKRMFPLLLALLLFLPACAPAEEEKVLNILTWAEYIDQDSILTPFEQETGIRIEYSYFDSNEEMLIKLQAQKGGTYDLILASDYILDIARQEGLIQKLNRGKLPNFDNIDPRYRGQYYDVNDEYTIPYVAGIPLILYDPSQVDFEITGYNSLWDERLRDTVVLMDDARNVIGITLKSMGESFNVTDPEILKAAEEKLMLLKPNIRLLDYNTTHQAMISGETLVGYMFTPAILWALSERPDLKIVYPEEGLGFGIDSFVIPVNAPHPDNAHKFLDFLLRPEIAVNIAEFQAYMNVNAAAAPLLSDEYKASLKVLAEAYQEGLTDPTQILDMEETEFIEDVGEAQLIFNDIWTRFKQF